MPNEALLRHDLEVQERNADWRWGAYAGLAFGTVLTVLPLWYSPLWAIAPALVVFLPFLALTISAERSVRRARRLRVELESLP